MFKRTITLLFTLLLLALPTFAQVSQQKTGVFDPVVITGLELVLDENNHGTLTISGNPQSCSPTIVEQDRDGNLIVISLSTVASFDDATCSFIAPFTETVILDGTFDPDNFYALLVNDVATEFFVPRKDAVPMDVMSPIMSWTEPNQLEISYFRSDAMIDKVEVVIGDSEFLRIRMQGNHPDGCAVTMQTRISTDKVDPELVHIEAFRVMSMAMMCPAMLAPFDETIDTGLLATEAHTLFINGAYYRYNPETSTLEPITRLYTAVEDVKFTLVDGSYQVVVASMQMGECGVPLTELYVEDAYAIYIEQFNDVPPMTPCTRNLILVERTFTISGDLPIVINGQAYFANGADSSEAPTGGEMMQVDHIIEGVDVLVLESMPAQLELTIRGYQPDGCEVPVLIEQTQTDNTINVHIYRELPADAICTMMVVIYEETIRLEGSFTSGSYTININGFTTTVEL